MPSRVCRVYLFALVAGLAGLTAGCPVAPAPPQSIARTQTLAPQPDSSRPLPPKELHVAAVGDIMLDRSVGQKIADKGCASIIAQVAEQLRAADIVFGNLECPLSTVGPPQPKGACIFRADPRTIKVLVLGGFDIVSLANNHTLNSGRAALMQTLDHLEQAGIAYVGAARNKEHGSAPRFLIVRGMRVGFRASTDLRFRHGSYSKVDQELTTLRAQIAQAKNNCNLLIVSYHWGKEYRRDPTRRQVEVAHTSIAAGADAVIGHHPHVLEGVEIYRNKPILYSMGNFVFDQRSGERMESGIFALHYAQGKGWRVEMTPVWIPWSRLGPEYASGERRERILRRFAQMSADLGTVVSITEGRACVDYPSGAPESEPAVPSTSTPSTAVH